MKHTLSAITVSCAILFSASASWSQSKNSVYYGVQLEQLELRHGDENEKMAVWNGDAFIGTDEIKLRWSSEGEYDRQARNFERLENSLVLQKPVSDFFDMKVGARVDTPEGADRWYGVLGVTGLAPQWFEVDADFYVSETGDASARLDVEYELLLTNKLILIPSADLNYAFTNDPEIGIGSGFSSFEFGTRLSYDLVDRAVSPYLGLVYERSLGNTADLARNEGEDVEGWSIVIGSRFLF